MDNLFTAARYHNLVIEQETFPHDALEATAWTEDGLIMAARHKKYKHIQVPLFPNVLYHPVPIGCLRWRSEPLPRMFSWEFWTCIIVAANCSCFQGVQFHPESIITPEGKKIILNFVRFIEELEKQRS